MAKAVYIDELRMQSKSSGFGASATSIGAVAGAVTAVGAAAGAFVAKGIAFTRSIETATIQFGAYFQAAGDAERHVRSLTEFAATTPFQMPGIIEASRLLLTFGADGVYGRDTLRQLGDAAAGTGAPLENVSMWVGRLVTNLKSGRPFGEASQRLQELGLMSGETRIQMEELAKAGGSTDEVMALLRGEWEKHDGAMERLSLTTAGLESTFGDLISQVSGAVVAAGGMDEAYKSVLTTSNNMLTRMREWVTGDASVATLTKDLEYQNEQLEFWYEGMAKADQRNLPNFIKRIGETRGKISDLEAQIEDLNEDNEDLIEDSEHAADALADGRHSVAGGSDTAKEELRKLNTQVGGFIDIAPQAIADMAGPTNSIAWAGREAALGLQAAKDKVDAIQVSVGGIVPIAPQQIVNMDAMRSEALSWNQEIEVIGSNMGASLVGAIGTGSGGAVIGAAMAPLESSLQSWVQEGLGPKMSGWMGGMLSGAMGAAVTIGIQALTKALPAIGRAIQSFFGFGSGRGEGQTSYQAAGSGGANTDFAGLADGGFARAGHPYIVGERGPELFVPGRSGTVVPNAGPTVIHTSVHLDGEIVAESVQRVNQRVADRRGVA